MTNSERKQYVNDALVDLENYESSFNKLDAGGTWKDGAYVHEPIILCFGYIEVTLLPDGKYFLSDVSGG